MGHLGTPESWVKQNSCEVHIFAENPHGGHPIEGEAGHASDDPVPVRAGHGAGAVCGFSPLHHLWLLEREPMLVGILKVLRLPPQCTFWRFLASLHLGIARQLLEVQRRMRQRVWEAAHVRLK